MNKLYVIGLVLLFTTSCASLTGVQPESASQSLHPETGCFDLTSLPDDDRELARDLLWEALDEVGLYTILDTLKAVSDVRSFRYPAIEDFTHADPVSNSDTNNTLHQIERVLSVLHCGSIHFVVTPFSAVYDGERYYQIRVVNGTVLNTVLTTYPEFWQNWGFVSGSDAATIITVVEYESRFNRFRGYGYLYGYPPHAVDFFVDAAREQQDTGDFVTRDFVQIPAYIRETGAFVYAVPKGHELNEIDEQLKNNATKTLEKYRALRENNSIEHPEKLIRYLLFKNNAAVNSN
ncbi:MAG: hypothetical protein LAT57_02390 [Balneolales bacterium]|nr:hypothetical protein [Balneolales bacterium]